MTKLEEFFDYIIDLDCLRTDDSKIEYCKVFDCNREDYSATLNANEESIKLIKEKLASLKLTYQLIEIDKYPNDPISLYKILDIGI